ncbi:MAG: hypothetical protein OEN48_07285 [Betaproteobacteria bacterium]|nr:hypothetical protein [Betaproteobacteria bacterium]
MAISLDFSQKTDLRLLGILVKQVSVAAAGTPFLMAGAMARDLLLVYAHEIRSRRATKDVDLALFVKNWDDFEAGAENCFPVVNSPRFRVLASTSCGFSERWRWIFFLLVALRDGTAPLFCHPTTYSRCPCSVSGKPLIQL